MDPDDYLPEEDLGTADALRTRAATASRMADACEIEAAETEAAVARLRARAARLREVALECRNAAHHIDQTGTGMDEVTR